MVVPLWNVKDNFNTVPEVLAPAIREQKELKGIPIGKEIQFSFFTNDMKNPKDYP